MKKKFLAVLMAGCMALGCLGGSLTVMAEEDENETTAEAVTEAVAEDAS